MRCKWHSSRIYCCDIRVECDQIMWLIIYWLYILKGETYLSDFINILLTLSPFTHDATLSSD